MGRAFALILDGSLDLGCCTEPSRSTSTTPPAPRAWCPTIHGFPASSLESVLGSDKRWSRFGAGHVAIGTDLAYIPSPSNAEYKKIGPRPRSRQFYEAMWPAGALDNRSHPSLSWTNWPMITVGMVQRGIPDDAIRKILGGNVMRVARAVWPGKA